MTSILSSETGSVSTIFATVTSIPSPPTDAVKNGPSSRLTTIEIVGVVIGSVVIFLLLVVILIYILVLRRSRTKYQHPGDKSKAVDGIEWTAGGPVSKTYQDNWAPISGHGGTAPLRITKPQHNLNRSLVTGDSQHKYPPPSSFVNDYEGQTMHESHVISLDGVRCPEETKTSMGFEAATLYSARQIYSNTPIKPAPLNIPEMLTNCPIEKRSIWRKSSRRSSADDSASLYSETSLSTHNSSKSVLETLMSTTSTLQPVPPIPPQFTTPAKSSLPESVSDIVVSTRREDTIIKSPPTTSFFAPPPVPRPDGGGPEGDYTETNDIVRLLHSRQSRLQKAPDPPSRNPSIISHIERPGSIKSVISLAGEEGPESCRPRYFRLKEKRSTKSSNLRTTYRRDSVVSMSSSSHSRDSEVLES